MRSRVLQALCLFTLLQFISVPCVYAWNDFGHMTVAYVAYKKLSAKTKARVNSLLKLNPHYQAWIREIGLGSQSSLRDAQILMLAATWPDLIKKDAKYIPDGFSDGNRPLGAKAKLNTGFSDIMMHKYWHFCDMPFACDGTKRLPIIPSPNAETQIAVFRKALASNAPDELKSYDLAWLLHLIGDLHQPLHCATRVSKFTPAGDNGGNDVLVIDGHNVRCKLHSFWDNCLGQGMPQDAIKFADKLPPAKASLAADKKANDWIKESFLLAQQKVYVYPIKWGYGPFYLTTDYRHNAVALAKLQVVLAGERLANILNNELK